jgi:hypothetical protein
MTLVFGLGVTVRGGIENILARGASGYLTEKWKELFGKFKGKEPLDDGP